MWDGPNLYRMLETEWNQIAQSYRARSACARWARGDAVLEGIVSPAEVVARCQARGHGAHSAAVLAAVLGHAATDDWAARTVLQAVLPGLAALSRRARPLVGAGRAWQHIDEVDQFLVANAYESITALASRSPRWPAEAVLAKTWRRLRDVADRECQRSTRQDSLSELGDLSEVPHTTAAAELARPWSRPWNAVSSSSRRAGWCTPPASGASPSKPWPPNSTATPGRCGAGGAGPNSASTPPPPSS
jgi:hypothetical protein